MKGFFSVIGTFLLLLSVTANIVNYLDDKKLLESEGKPSACNLIASSESQMLNCLKSMNAWKTDREFIRQTLTSKIANTAFEETCLDREEKLGDDDQKSGNGPSPQTIDLLVKKLDEVQLLELNKELAEIKKDETTKNIIYRGLPVNLLEARIKTVKELCEQGIRPGETKEKAMTRMLRCKGL